MMFNMKEIDNEEEEKDFFTKVLILAIYNKRADVTIENLITELDANGAIVRNESEEILKKLEENKFFVNGKFTSAGKIQVEEAQKFFQR